MHKAMGKGYDKGYDALPDARSAFRKAYDIGYDNALLDVTRALNRKLEEVRGMFHDALANRNTNDAYHYHLQAGGLCDALILVAELDDKARPTEEVNHG
jgi:hypothetical protein